MYGSLAHASVFAQEITFGWPFNEYERQAYSVQAHRVLEAVGLKHIPVTTPLQQLSGGYKRRVALAVQLVRRPAVSTTPNAIAQLLRSACFQILTPKSSLPVCTLVSRPARYTLWGAPLCLLLGIQHAVSDHVCMSCSANQYLQHAVAPDFRFVLQNRVSCA